MSEERKDRSEKPTESQLEQIILKEPIKIPRSDLAAATISLGGDEGLAFLMNAAFTFSTEALNMGSSAVALSGPVGEKFIFLGRQIYSALQERKKTPEALRLPRRDYIKRGIAEGTENLILDVCFHDPTYTGLMYLFLERYPEVPTALALPLSFVTGLAVATLGKVALNKSINLWRLHSLRQAGMDKELYYEVRFLFPNEITKEQLEDTIFEEFGLVAKGELEYHDTYFPSKQERSKLRLRERTNLDGGQTRTAQLVFSRPGTIGNKYSPWNCFPSRKTKFYTHLKEEKFPSSLEELSDEKIRKAFLRWKRDGSDDEIRKIDFTRYVALSDSGLYLALDHVVNGDGRPFKVVEAKVYPHNLDLLERATRFIMYHYSKVLQTTYGKHDLALINGSK